MGLKSWFIKRAITNFVKKLEKENNPMFKWLKGKKTYITLGVTAVLGAIGALNQAGATDIQIPELAFTILGALGLWSNSQRTSK